MLTFDDFYSSDQPIPENTLLLNIETTGLSPRNAFVFMVGLGWKENSGCHFRCLLAEKRMDERLLMQTFQQILQNYHQVLTYGGTSFTFRFLEERFKNYSTTDFLSESPQSENALFQNIHQLDIQKLLVPYKHLLPISDLKKRTVEQLIHYNRTEHLTPEALIKCYSSWEVSGESLLLMQLKQHHLADMTGLISLYTLTAYTLFFKGDFLDVHHDIRENAFCQFQITLKMPVPVPIELSKEGISLFLAEQTAKLIVPLFQGELKYFLPGPVKDYYYLPKEDQAVHRSVACYVDKAYRQKATADTCYIRQSGLFLKAADTSLQPCFRESYQDKRLYIAYDVDKFDREPDFVKQYLKNWLSCLKK